MNLFVWIASSLFKFFLIRQVQSLPSAILSDRFQQTRSLPLTFDKLELRIIKTVMHLQYKIMYSGGIFSKLRSLKNKSTVFCLNLFSLRKILHILLHLKIFQVETVWQIILNTLGDKFKRPSKPLHFPKEAYTCNNIYSS